MIRVSVQQADFDLAAEVAAIRAGRTDIGAIVSFTGLVRDMSKAGPVETMTLEHYPGMTERQLGAIAAEAAERWPLQAVTVIHRHGTLAAGDQIVLVAVASAHRQAAFDAAMFLMDWLKTKAPFWKRESGAGGNRWVEADTRDDAAAERWARTP